MDAPPIPPWFTEATAVVPEDRTVRVKGCDIHYLRWGDPERPGIVFVHGGAAHAQWWSFIAPFLAPQHHVIAVDLSGHGDSGRRAFYAIETWADEVVGCAADCGMTRPVLVGHSMGGLVTIAAANLHGESLAGGVVIDSPVHRPDPESEEGERGRMFRNPKTYPDLETAVEHFHLQPPQPVTNPYIVDFVARRSLRQAPGQGGWTWKFDAKVFERHRQGIADYLAEVHCRIAVFRGQHSDLVTPDVQDYIDELLGRSSPIVEIPAAYHHVPLDQPLALVAALRAILADWEHSIPRRRLGRPD